jgi:hypothetical protein
MLYLEMSILSYLYSSGHKLVAGNLKWKNLRLGIAAAIFVNALFVFVYSAGHPSLHLYSPSRTAALRTRDAIMASAKEFMDSPLPPSAVGQMGRRTETLTKWMEDQTSLQSHLTRKEAETLSTQLENVVLSMYPFVENPQDPQDMHPFSNRRKNIVPGSAGIVITCGRSHYRYALHLIGNIRTVLQSELPIQVMYVGSDELPESYRSMLTSKFHNVETLDLLTMFNDTTLDLRHGTWAIKPFAVLASKFEQVIMADADTVFLQKPEVILQEHSGYKSRGMLLFHDRLFGRGGYQERHEWWQQEMAKANRSASDTLQKSKVWNEGYGQECDSGVVVLDKSRLPILMALLHICWQNSAKVRTQVTYRKTHGDKESWWFACELCGVPYTFEDHYGAVMGQIEMRDEIESVCSFTIAHLDESEMLLWFNGSLLKNKVTNMTEFAVPDTWMVDGEWDIGQRPALSCMRKADIRIVGGHIKEIVASSVAEARELERCAEETGINLFDH